jgi:hypothetical protein
MVAGEVSDLYASNTCTWLATSSGPGANEDGTGEEEAGRCRFDGGLEGDDSSHRFNSSRAREGDQRHAGVTGGWRRDSAE